MDIGLTYEERPEHIIRRIRGSKVRQLAGCDDDMANRLVNRRIETRWRWPGGGTVFRLASTPVLLENAEYRHNGVRIGGKWLLSGAAGNRIWTRNTFKRNGGFDTAAEIADIESRRGAKTIPALNSPGVIENNIAFAVDLRNGFNFYHFLTEGLPQIAVISRVESRAPIHIHMPRLSDLKGFVRSFIETIYPDVVDRVVFTDTRTLYARVRAVYQHRHYLYQVDDPTVRANLEELVDDP